jgi:hypothetical protein
MANVNSANPTKTKANKSASADSANPQQKAENIANHRRSWVRLSIVKEGDWALNGGPNEAP